MTKEEFEKLRDRANERHPIDEINDRFYSPFKGMTETYALQKGVEAGFTIGSEWAYQFIERLERENKELRDSFQWIMPKVHQGNHEGEFASCEKAVCAEYRLAMAKADRIRKEEK